MAAVSIDQRSKGKTRLFWPIVLSVLVLTIGFVSYKDISSPKGASRVVTLEQEVKCPTCIDLSVYNSNDATSYTMRVFIKKAVAGGESNSEILDTLVTTYGSEILMTPPKSGINLLLWFLPASFLLAAVSEIVYLRRRSVEIAEVNGETIPIAEEIPTVKNVSYLRQKPRQRSLSALRVFRTIRSQGKRAWLLLGSVVLVLSGSGVATYGLLSGSSSSAPSTATVDQQVLDAEVLAGAGQLDSASQILSKVLQEDPRQPQALAYEGWISCQVGALRKDKSLISRGLSLISQSISISPSYAMGHLFYGVVLYSEVHDAASSVKQFKLAIRYHVQKSVLEQVKATVDQAYQSEGLRPPL
jgi:cytochrome c-type biogenesis protein CcmH/NrfF